MKHLLIKPETCLGDKWHNESIAKIMSARGPYAKQVHKALSDLLAAQNQRHNERLQKIGCKPRKIGWCGIEKQEAQRIYAIANSKTAKTFIKRCNAFADFLTAKEHYGALFNKPMIDLFKSLSTI